jgi:Zn-dependent protease with chaperone function
MPGTVPVTTSLFELSGVIQPPRLSLRYRVGLVIVAMAMLILPVIYLSLVIGAAWVVWWHATTNVWIVEGRTNQLTLLAYVSPIVAGAILVFFLFKPVIARPNVCRGPISLSPVDEPEIFHFIETICAQVRAPIPRLVQVDCHVNASASFMPIRFGILKRDLVLTIGLPLVAGLSVRGFSGVLAHEFGHFAQRSGMRLTALVRSINHWFARVVYERDRWDGKLDEWARDQDWRSFLIVALARGGIWASRRVLAALMRVGQAVSCFMLRQMEYDADHYEIQLTGSAAFVRTSVRIRELHLAAHLAYQEIQHSWQARTLPADLPQFLVQHETTIPDAARAAARDVSNATTRLWDTHPSDADRIRAAEVAAAPGIIADGDASAKGLFRQFDALSAEATRHHYTHDLELDVTDAALVDRQDVNAVRQRREDRRQTLRAYLGECVSLTRPLVVSWRDVASRDDSQLREALIDARHTMAADAASVTAHYRQFEWYTRRRSGARAAEEFLLAGGAIEDAQGVSDLAEPTLESAISSQSWAVAMQDEHRPPLDRFEAAVVQRLACGLVLADRHGTSGATREAAAALEITAACIPAVLDVYENISIINLLAAVLRGKPQALSQRVDVLGARITRSLDALAERLARTPCPAALTARPMSIGAWCGLDSARERENPPQVLDRLTTVYWQVLEEVVTIAATAEEVVRA